MNRVILRTLAPVIVAIVATACSSAGNWQPSEAALAGDPVAMWEEGQIAVSQGEELISRGASRLADGRSDVRNGEALLSEGNELVIKSRGEYQIAARTSGGSITPEQIEEEANRLRAIGRRWENGIDQIKRGNRLISSGNEDINRAQSDVRQGRVLVESGSNLMRNSQRIQLGDDLLAPVPE